MAFVGLCRERQYRSCVILAVIALVADAHAAHRWHVGAIGQRGLFQLRETGLCLSIAADGKQVGIVRTYLYIINIPALEGITDVGRCRTTDVIACDNGCLGRRHRTGTLRYYRCRKRAQLYAATYRGRARQRHVAHRQVLTVSIALRHTYHHLPGIIAGRGCCGHVKRCVVVVGVYVGMTVYLTQLVCLRHLACRIQFQQQYLEGRAAVLYPRCHTHPHLRRHVGQVGGIGLDLKYHAVVVAAVSGTLHLEAQQLQSRHLFRGVALRRYRGLECQFRTKGDARLQHLLHVRALAGRG